MQLIKITFSLFILGIVSNLSFAQQSIKTQNRVLINGIDQCIKIESKNSEKPILLFLHGGPGFSSRKYFKKVKKGIQNDFIIVQWHERETGITKVWNKAPKPITIAQMHQDTEEVVDYLLKKFNRKKLLLVGYAWGNYLGMTYASKYPEKLIAYVNVSGMISNNESEELTLNLIREKAEKEKNIKAINEIKQIKLPFENWKQLQYQRKWTAYYSGVINKGRAYPSKLIRKWATTWFEVFLSASNENFKESIPILNCPVFFMSSKKDLISNFELSAEYFKELEAPQKELIWFEESTHSIPIEEPKKFVKELIRIGTIIQ